MPVILGALAALIIVALIVGFVLTRRRRRKALEAHAEALLSWGDFERAARDLKAAGKWERAAELFIQAGCHLEAAQLRLAHAQPEAALDALVGASRRDIEATEEGLARAKVFGTPTAQRRFAQLARDAGAFNMAVRFYEKLGDAESKRQTQLDEAASLKSSGKHLEAAELFEELGEKLYAAQSKFEAARTEQDREKRQSLARMASGEFLALNEFDGAVNAMMVAEDADRAVELLVSKGQKRRAASILEQKGLWSFAAELYEDDGDLLGAAKSWRHGGDLRKSAELLEKAGKISEAAHCMAELNDMKAAGGLLLKSGDLQGALQCFIVLDDLELPEVAQLLFTHGHVKAATDLLIRRNQVRTAANLLNANGYGQWASQLLAQLGDRFEQAKILAANGKWEEAAALMVELEKFEDAYKTLKGRADRLGTKGMVLLAKVALRMGRHDESIEIYSHLLASGKAGAERMDILYGLARAYEAVDKFFEATASLQEILTIDPNFRDAALQLRLLQGKMAPQPFAVAGKDGTNFSTRYRILSEAGRGSMGVVYRAMDEQLNRPVAIKVLDQPSGGGEKLREYFLREARAVAQLNHPNIVTIYDAGLQDKTPWLVMELVDGEDLRTRFQEGRPSLMQSLKIGAQVAAALDCAHAKGIVHRDLKPENIMVSDDGNSKLMDFGIAYVMQSEGQESNRKNTVVGTPVYMAPEQIRGKHIDGRVDIYSLGVVLFECLCGSLPFDPKAAMYHNVNTPPPDPRSFRPDLAPELAELVLQCLAKSPDERPQSAYILERTLKQIGLKLSKNL